MRKMITQRIRLCSDTDCRGHNGSDGRPYARKGHMPEKATQWLCAATILKVIGLEAILKEVSCNESPFLSYITRCKHSDLLVLQEKMVHTYDHHFVGFWLMYMLPAKIKRGYGEFGRVASVSSAVPALAFCFFYLPGTAMVSGMTGTAGLLTNGLAVTRAVTRDPHRRHLVTAVSNAVGVSSHSAIEYGYDILGNVTDRNNDAFGYNARYELAYALLGADRFNYSYDSIGNNLWISVNAVTNTYAANRLNQYSLISNHVNHVNPVRIHPTYDADGNMRWDGRMWHTWDAENRLVRSEPGLGGATNGSVRVVNSYDHRHRRIQKRVEVLTGRGAGYPLDPSQAGTWDVMETRTFIYDGWNLTAEVVVDAQTGTTNVTRYLWGPDLSGTLQGAGGVGGLLAVIRSDGAFFPCYDANGNVTDYVDANGTVRGHFEYDAFGNTIAMWGDLVHTFKFRFSTKYWDEETRSYYYGYRHYAPKLGCWLSKDPIGEEGGLNLYAICENNLLDRFDPTGETWTTNWEFFWDWVLERGEENRIYGTGTVELEEMQSSPGAKHMRRTYKAGGCKTIKNGSFGTAKAYFTTIWFPNKTAFQVGGFLYDAVNNGDGTVTYSIRNQASAYSFFLHIPGVPHKPRGGTIRLFGNINQTFIFTEKSPCCDKKKEGK